MRGKTVAALVVVVLAFFAGGWLLRRGLSNAPAPAAPRVAGEGGTKLFNAVLATVRNYAVDSLDESAIYRLATSGVLTELDDPYAALIPDSDTLRSRTSLGPDPVQGLYLDAADGLVAVVSVVPESPGALAGLRSGDVILRVDAKTLNGDTPEQVARMVAGADGSTVRLRIGRTAGEPALWVEVVRGPVPPLPGPTVAGIGDDLALIRVYAVDSFATELVRATVDSLGRSGGRGLVLDLRGAVGGTLAGAVSLAEVLLRKGQAIVVSLGRNGADSTIVMADGAETQPDLSVVVLVDRGTAGPAEVVAGALQDHDRAAVIGETTFGRGGAVSYFPVGSGTSLRLITEVWRTPRGRTIQRFLATGTESLTDSVARRPSIKTESGRTLFGGGGIVPDVDVALAPESGASDALAVARALLVKHPNRKALIAGLADPRE